MLHADILVGRGLKVVDGGDRVGRVGGLICGENTNPLGQYAVSFVRVWLRWSCGVAMRSGGGPF